MNELWFCQKCQKKIEGSLVVVLALAKEHEIDCQQPTTPVPQTPTTPNPIEQEKPKEPQQKEEIYTPFDINKFKRKSANIMFLRDWFTKNQTITLEQFSTEMDLSYAGAMQLLKKCLIRKALDRRGSKGDFIYFVPGGNGENKANKSYNLLDKRDYVREDLEGEDIVKYDELIKLTSKRNIMISDNAKKELIKQPNFKRILDNLLRQGNSYIDLTKVQSEIAMTQMQEEAIRNWEVNFKEFNVPKPIFEMFGVQSSLFISRFVASAHMSDKKLNFKNWKTFVHALPDQEAESLFYDWLVLKLPEIIRVLFREVVNVKYSRSEGLVEWK